MPSVRYGGCGDRQVGCQRARVAGGNGTLSVV